MYIAIREIQLELSVTGLGTTYANINLHLSWTFVSMDAEMQLQEAIYYFTVTLSHLFWLDR